MSGPARVKRLTRELQECKKDVHLFLNFSLSLSRLSFDCADNDSRITETLYIDDCTN
jgi:hypothetical protein